MFEENVKAVSALRDEIYNVMKANQGSPTIVSMGRNATMFLDTAYMWMDTMRQYIKVMHEAKDAAVEGVENGTVTPVDFSQQKPV